MIYTKKSIFFLSLFSLIACSEEPEIQPQQDKPNIILLYVDDLGYGDIGVNGATKVKTPHIDRLAAEGINFTDAHSSAATCTPSRYALLTGEHGFRIDSDILEGDAPALIASDRPTLPKMLKKAGYKTAVIGKWHLGLGDGNVNWNEPVLPGPLEIGFDYSFLLPITGDRVPTVYLEGHHVVNADPNDPISVSYTGKIGDRPHGSERPDLVRYQADPQHNETIINGVARIGSMAGGEKALWDDENIPNVLNDKAIDFIKSSKDDPFFLYYAYHDIHVPRMPHPDFVGSTDMGPRGDAIAQVDWVVGEIMAELENQNLSENTIVIFTSDNGPVLNDGYMDDAVERLGSHLPAGKYRGGKYSAYEAGTRMPTILKWPSKVAPGTSNALVSQIDLYASLASYLGIKLETGEAKDSLNQWDAYLGKDQTGRELMIEESVVNISLRQGSWKYIVPTTPDRIKRAEWVATDKDIDGGFMKDPQLYNLSDDPSEQNNLASEMPDKVQQMQAIIDHLQNNGFRE
ncbi:arylsulfatase [Emcibacteraceae bacterium Y4]|uniref:sulfatase family protein n=1 Tax=Pseudemcibacter aquimaris TaxID=2857064 RepID=UPI0020123EB2|nr:arylsulfatase [Pseudemcibacter aquimaris]MCC3861741.1 arylsulfatase [Pseudemcibacter aquimaris]